MLGHKCQQFELQGFLILVSKPQTTHLMYVVADFDIGLGEWL